MLYIPSILLNRHTANASAERSRDIPVLAFDKMFFAERVRLKVTK